VFLTYLMRELRRRTRQTVIVAVGLAVGIGLVITVSAASKGVANAQGQVLSNLYGVGTDITVTQQVTAGSGQGQGGGFGRFDFGQGDTTSDSVTQDRLVVGRGTTAMDAASIATVTGTSHVARAVGGLALTDVTVSGDFTPPTAGTDGGSTGGFQRNGTRPNIGIDTFSIDGVDVNSLDIGPLSAATLSAGRAFTADDATANVALLSDTYANQKGLAVDGTITVAGTPLTVVGTVSSSGGESSDVFIPLGTAQTLAGQADKVTTIYVQASSADAVDTAKSEIEAALPGTTVTTTSDLASQISGSLSNAANLANNLGKWLSILVLIAAFAVAALFTISGVARRMREFGTLKALGWRGRRIIGQVAGESVVQGVIGGVVGILLGLLGARLVASLAPPLTASVASGLGNVANRFGNGGGGFAGGGGANPLPSAGAGGGGFAGGPGGAFRAASEVSVHLTAPVTLSAIGLAVGLAVAGGLIAGAFGGWRASRLRPADALRRID